MKKIIMCIVWFPVIGFFLGLVFGFSFTMMDPSATDQQYTEAFNEAVPLITLISLLFSIIGTMTEKLPGTRS